MKKHVLYGLLALLFFAQCSEAPKTPQAAAPTAASKPTAAKNILFFGNSITAGYGLDDMSKSWVSLLQARIDSLQLSYNCINGGNSGETSAGGKERVEWVAGAQAVDVFVLELGGNDALRGLSPDQCKANLQAIIDKVKALHPSTKIVLAGMEAPRNLGTSYTNQFKNVYKSLAETNKIPLIPFILENVAGNDDLNQKDRIHPNEAGNRIVAENVWAVLKTIL